MNVYIILSCVYRPLKASADRAFIKKAFIIKMPIKFMNSN